MKNPVHWEEIFIQEALELEEKMKTLDTESLNKSKLRIGLETQILSWEKYENWYMNYRGCSSIKTSVTESELKKFFPGLEHLDESFGHHEFWSEDLIAFSSWDGQLIVIGLQYNENLVALENVIFILAPPRVLAFVAQNLLRFQNRSANSTVLLENGSDADEMNSAPEGIFLDVPAPSISFAQPAKMILPATPDPILSAVVHEANLPPKAAVLPVAAKPAFPKVVSFPPPPSPMVIESTANSVFNGGAEAVDGIWDFISERHQEYSFEIKKQFDAFVVLKVNQKKTQVFKMDPDLARGGVNHMIFEYNLETEGPFKTIYNNGKTEKFSLKQLEMHLADFQQACITPLRRGEKTVGFFVGFKKGNLSQQDQSLLEELAGETAS